MDPSIAKEAFDLLRALAKDEDSHVIRSTAVEALGPIMKALKLDVIVELKLLHNQDPIYRNAALKTLLIKLPELPKSIESNFEDTFKANKDLIKILLSIIGHESKDDEENVKAVAASAKIALYKIAEQLGGTENKFIMQQVNENFDALLNANISSETAPFFKALFHKALSDGEISKIDKEFIIKCIKAGFTSSFTDKDQIIFEGKTYNLCPNGSNQEIIARNKAALFEIINTALEQEGDILSKQYKTHDPLFPNNNDSFKISANDVADVKSLASAEIIEGGKWILSLVQAAKHNKSTGAYEQFILLESRDPFGELVLRKISPTSTPGLSIVVAEITMHPDEVINKTVNGSATLKEVFFGVKGGEVIEDVLVYYQLSSLVISEEEQQNLAKVVNNVSNVSGSSMSLVDIICDAITETEFDKEKLGKEWQGKLQAYELIAMELSQEGRQIDNLSKRVDELDQAFKDTILKDADILQQVIDDTKFRLKDRKEQDQIGQDSYKNAFYKTLRMELNSCYLAAKSIDSGWVESNKKGDMGQFGSFAREVSSLVPFVGGGVKMLGTILKIADGVKQKAMIKNYATFTTDSSEMAIIAEKIARKIALKELTIVKKDQSMQAKIKGFFLNAPDNFCDAIESVAEEIESKIDSKLEGENPSAEAKKGAADAKIVAQMIAGKIFAGEFNIDNIDDKAEEISAFIENEFTPLAAAADEECVVCDQEQKPNKISKVVPVSTIIKESDFFDKLLSEEQSEIENQVQFQPKSCCTVMSIKVEHENPILNNQALVRGVSIIDDRNKRGESLLKLIELGNDKELAEEILSKSREYGAKHVIDIIFGNLQYLSLAETQESELSGHEFMEIVA